MRPEEKPVWTPDTKDFEGFMINNVKINPNNWNRYQYEVVKGLNRVNLSFVTDLENNGYKFDSEFEIIHNSFEKSTYILVGRQNQVVGFSDMLFFPSQFTNCNFHVINNFNCFLEETINDIC
ncbi:MULTISPECIES: hypothetical protein [Oceanobacillus]|uniref:hypothetical protein n=1 Tax=Oceanobacillus TaxID=182709 RepID=UPI0009850C03|nr:MULTISPECIES: hypothetical protein [Oceanobacillus]MBT2599365.1 hypothetical protein [Oceanobacillus sp. ISL-74]MBT2652283.1 hypothetical protein [Oceanobacillus sp. ISL-73]